MIIYEFDDKKLLKSVITMPKGTNLAANQTTIAPPHFDDGKIPKWDGEGWNLVDSPFAAPVPDVSLEEAQIGALSNRQEQIEDILQELILKAY